MDTGEAAILAALCVILVSIPAASQNVEVTEEGYSGFIDSEFSDMFEVDFRPGKLLLEMFDSERRLEVNKSYMQRKVKLQTSKGFIRKLESSNSINTTVQTPYGRFKSGVVNGENFSDFDGGDKEKAEEVKKALENELEESLESANKKKMALIQEMLPAITVDVEARNDDVEHFKLSNNGEEKVELEDWTVVAEDSDGEVGGSIEPETGLEAGEKRIYYSSTREVLEENGYETAENAVFDSGLNIYNGGGAVKVYTGEKRLVDSQNY